MSLTLQRFITFSFYQDFVAPLLDHCDDYYDYPYDWEADHNIET